MGEAEITVPATSANLGPGFDCLGAALGLHLRVRFSHSDRSEIKGKGRIRAVEDSLIHRSYLAAFEAAGAGPPPVRIEVLDDYPSGRGLGASASAIVAGLAGGNAIGSLGLTTEDLAALATRIEGHPDNVLPALVGGIVLNVGRDWMRFEPADAVSPLVLVARTSFKTGAARKVLPDTVTRQDAVANASAVAGLLTILAGHADPGLLLEATEDKLHEPHRLPLMPESLGVHRALRDKGFATALSGAGPSLLCLVESEGLDEAAEAAAELIPEGWQILRPGWDLRGAATGV